MHLLTHSLLREYLELEFSGIPTPFPLDAERVVDDFVLFCMLVGNDFLPGKLGCLDAICCAYAVIVSCSVG
jgi:5'-3' exonuclease